MADFDVIIVGGGISGLAALHFLKQQNKDLSVQLLEADDRLGGTIGTDRTDGYSFDWGPNGFLDREPLTLRLCEKLGLNDLLEPANGNVSNRFIYRGGRLRSVPMSPPKFLASDILSLMGRLRVMMEPFGKSAPEGVDESIYDFVKRRIGREAADYLVQPMVSGVYGGVAQKLSLRSCFPIMHEMESEYGSLIKAMIARARKAKAEGKKSGGPGGPGGWLTSFRGGLYALIERLHETYGDYIQLSAPVESLTKDAGRYTVQTSSGDRHMTRHVILATPSYKAVPLVQSLSASLASALEGIEYAPIAVVCLGYDQSTVSHDLNGFGFLVPQVEKPRILGSIWTSSIFNNRAPQGKVQFRTMIGGDGDHNSVDLSDEELYGIVASDLRDILGISGKPEIRSLYRWRHGIPQFKIGHSETMATIERELSVLHGLHVTGNAYYGIGLNDCVKQSHRVSLSILNANGLS